MFKMKMIEINSIKYETSQELHERSIFLAFTTRQKGVSLGEYQSLNLAFHVNDKDQNVVENRELIAKASSLDPLRFTCCQQVHGNKALMVEEKNIGAGSVNLKNSIPRTDSLITMLKNVPLMLFYADCLPVVLVSLEPSKIAVIHAGYKGLLGNIIKETFNKFSDKYGNDSIYAFLGPSIGSCCYEVDSQRFKLFTDLFPQLIGDKSNFLDLKKIATLQLNKLGINDSHIISSKHCTYCNEDLFYSFRRNHVTGRQAAIASIME